MILNPPFSTITIGSSMSGKTHLWLKLLKNGCCVFGRRPSAYFFFGNSDLGQFEPMREHLGTDKVHIHPVSELQAQLPNIGKHAFVLLDEVNSAVVGMSTKEKREMLDLIKSFYNEHTHHRELYLVTILQHAIKSLFYELIALSQSLSLASLAGKSVSLLRRLELDSETTAHATALLRCLKGTPQFVFVFHNPSAYFPFLHRFIWAFLDYFPHFAIAVGEAGSFGMAAAAGGSSFANDFGTISTLEDDTMTTLNLAKEHDAIFRQATRDIPRQLEENMYVLVPLSSIAKARKEGDGPAAAEAMNPAQAQQARDQQNFDALDGKVTEMLHCVCSVRELAAFKRFWFFVKKMASFSINPEGTILAIGDRQVNLMSFFKECLRQPVYGVAAAKRKKQDTSKLQEFVPFVAAMLREPEFPSYLIRNKLLLDLAHKHLNAQGDDQD